LLNSKPLMRNILLFLSLAFLLGACELFPETEPENTLPPITQIGANTFGCKVNGKLWLPYKDGGLFSGSALVWELGPNTFSLDPINEKNNFRDIIVELRPGEPIQEGRTYYFSIGDSMRFYAPDSTDWYLSWGGGGGNGLCDYGFPTNGLSYSEGWIRITKYDPYARESDKGIVAGEFEYIAYPRKEEGLSAWCDTLTQPIHVTEGRFDINTLNR